jgi:hypothetical protein
MNIKKIFLTALLAGVAALSFAQAPAGAAGSNASAHATRKKAPSAHKAKSAHHKPKHAKKHHSTRQHAKKKAPTQRAGKANKPTGAGPGLQAY